MEEEEFAKNETELSDTCSVEDIFYCTVTTTLRTNQDCDKSYLFNSQSGIAQKHNDLRSTENLRKITLKYINRRLRDSIHPQKCLQRLSLIKTGNNKQMDINYQLSKGLVDTASLFGLKEVKHVNETIHFPVANVNNGIALVELSKDQNSQDASMEDENVDVSKESLVTQALENKNNIMNVHLDVNRNTNYLVTDTLAESKETPKINLELITEDPVDSNEVLDQILNKHLILQVSNKDKVREITKEGNAVEADKQLMQGDDIELIKVNAQNELEKSTDNKLTENSIESKEVLDQIFKMPQRIIKRKKRKLDIIDKKDIPIVTINIIFNSDTNNYEVEQKVNYTNTEESQVSTIESTDFEDESLEKYLKFHKRPVRATESDAETDEEEQADCENNNEKLDKKFVIGYKDDVRKEIDEESQPAKSITTSIEDPKIVIPECKGGSNTCMQCSKNYPTPQHLRAHDCTKKPVLDNKFNKTLKKSPKPSQKGVNKSQKRKDESKNRNKETKKLDEEPSIPYIRKGVDAKPVPCPICKKIFSRRSGLRIHLRRHKKEKPYHCEYCKKGFVTLYDVDRHMVTHVGKKRNRLMCEVCAKPFVSKAGLIQHKKIVHRFYTYVCDICEMPFNEERLLNKHLEEHEEADAIDESLQILESIEAENLALQKTQTSIDNTKSERSKPTAQNESGNENNLNDINNSNASSQPVPLEDIELDMIHPSIETQETQLIETIASDITPNVSVSPQHESTNSKDLDDQSKTKVEIDKTMQYIPLHTIKTATDPVTGKYIQNQSPVLINLNQIQSSVPSISNGTSLINIKQQTVKSSCEMIDLNSIDDGSIKIIPSQQIKLIDFNRSIVIENDTLMCNENKPTRTAQIIPSNQVEIEFIDLKQSSEDFTVTSETMNEHDVHETIKQLSFRSKDTVIDCEMVTSTVDESSLDNTVLVNENMPEAMEISDVLVTNEIEIVNFDVNKIKVIDETAVGNNLGTNSDGEAKQTAKLPTFVGKPPKKKEEFYDEFEEDKCTNDQMLLKEALEEITNTNALIQEAEKLEAENFSGDADSYFLNGKIELLNVMSPSAVSDMDEDLNCSQSDGVLP